MLYIKPVAGEYMGSVEEDNMGNVKIVSETAKTAVMFVGETLWHSRHGADFLDRVAMSRGATKYVKGADGLNVSMNNRIVYEIPGMNVYCAGDDRSTIPSILSSAEPPVALLFLQRGVQLDLSAVPEDKRPKIVELELARGIPALIIANEVNPLMDAYSIGSAKSEAGKGIPPKGHGGGRS